MAVETSGFPKYLLGIEDLTTEQINQVHSLARKFEEDAESFGGYKASLRRGAYKGLDARNIYLIFAQESTRTRVSFELAAKSLGTDYSNKYLGLSSEKKGEHPQDTLTMYNTYAADIVVLRTGSDIRELDLSGKNFCLINAGDKNEHPTQALLDSYVMANEAGVENIRDLDYNVAFIGNTEGYRAAQSLAKLLDEHTGCKISNVLPRKSIFRRKRGEPMDEKWGLKEENVFRVNTENELAEAIKDADILYITRPPYKGAVVHGITPENLDEWGIKAKIMDPLPRTQEFGELSTDFDTTERDLYLKKQPEAGVRIRLALLALMIYEYDPPSENEIKGRPISELMQ